MGQFIDNDNVTTSKQIDKTKISIVGKPTALKILEHLAKNQDYTQHIAETLKMDAQLVHYYIQKLLKAGVISITKRDKIKGAFAVYYSLEAPALTIILEKNWKPIKQLKKIPSFLSEFFKNNRIDAKIIVGSPDYHGENRQRARDAHYAVNLAFYLGSFSSTVEDIIYLDTEIKQSDLHDNLICIGGPYANAVTEKLISYAPVKFMGRSIYSEKTKKEYQEGTTGIVVKFDNPYAKGKKILLLAGKSSVGTQAAVLSLIKGNSAQIVEGIDINSDGKIDEIEIKE